jgi:recombination protein RecA
MKKEIKKEEESEGESVKDIMKRLQKKYGDIEVIDSNPDISGITTSPTGSFGLNYILGCDGLPRSRMIELFGQESSGKTTLAHHLISQVQKAGGKAVLFDVEFCYDPIYSSSIGVDTEKLVVIQSLTLESTMETMKELVESNQFDLIVLDSVDGLVPQSEAEGEFLKDTMGLRARKLGSALRVLVGAVGRSKTTIIFLNQLREKLGIIYGKKETTPGGKALKFYSSIRLEVSKGTKIVDKNDIQIGNQITITAVKNKVGFPWKKTTLDLYYGKGIDLVSDALLFGEQIGIITKSGNTYSFGEVILGVSYDKAIKTITGDDKLFEDIKSAIKKKLKNDNK